MLNALILTQPPEQKEYYIVQKFINSLGDSKALYKTLLNALRKRQDSASLPLSLRFTQTIPDIN